MYQKWKEARTIKW